MTWNLGRPLVAAWLNVSAGNDPTCVVDTINAAIGWLLDHPLGSGIGGGDPAWREASVWAAVLDDYNNGRLCAEHRDSGGGDAAASPEDSTATVSSPLTQPQTSDDGYGEEGHNGNGGSKQGPPKGKSQGGPQG